MQEWVFRLGLQPRLITWTVQEVVHVVLLTSEKNCEIETVKKQFGELSQEKAK